MSTLPVSVVHLMARRRLQQAHLLTELHLEVRDQHRKCGGNIDVRELLAQAVPHPRAEGPESTRLRMRPSCITSLHADLRMQCGAAWYQRKNMQMLAAPPRLRKPAAHLGAADGACIDLKVFAAGLGRRTVLCARPAVHIVLRIRLLPPLLSWQHKTSP